MHGNPGVNASSSATVKQCLDYTMFPWSIQSQLQPMLIAGGKGCMFWDADGNQYLDFSSQLECLNAGHQHPKIVDAIVKQARELCYISPVFATSPKAELGRLLAEVTPGNLKRTFFTLGGSDANESAMKLARWYTGRHKMISCYRSYHGDSHGAASLTGESRRWSAEPAIPGVVHVPAPYCYRCDFGKQPDSCDLECAKFIAQAIEYEGPEHVAAVIVEGVMGSNGILMPERNDYLPTLRRICTEAGVLLIADEVMSGFGRTGEWFAVNNWKVVPDIMTMAKGLTGAHTPLGAAIVSEPIGQFFEGLRLTAGFTYGGHPVGCAAGVAAIQVYREEHLVENAKALGQVLSAELRRLKDKHPSVGNVRGIGLFQFIELVKNRETKKPFGPYSTRTAADQGLIMQMRPEFYKRGLHVMTHPLGLFVAPPLCVSREELTRGLAIIDEVIGLVTDRAYEG